MSRATRRWWIGFPVLLVLVVLVGALQLQTRRAQQARNPDRARRRGLPIPVRTVAVTEGEVEEVIGATAVTEPAKTAIVYVGRENVSTPRLELKFVHVPVGDRVEKGQPLFEFDDSLFVFALKQHEAALAYAEAEVGALTRLRARGAVDRLQLQRAEVDLETARFEHEFAKQNLDRCRVVSPMAGIVSSIDAVAGRRIYDSVPLATIQQLDPIHVRMDFPVERLDVLETGLQAEVVLDSFPQETFTGTVTRISAEADIATRVLPVIVEVANPDHRIKAGITGFVRIRVPKIRKTVPGVAVIQRGGNAMVFAVENERAHIRSIRTGQTVENGLVEVIDGVNVGDEVVVYGHDSLKDRDPVDPNWRKWANRD